ncbi:conserved hypothetical protein (plasmid) [Borreliella burgdorferi 29805]|uniref:hypothetical protein n=1 Tax=Borreliella burgdorferi TaxID=139 RepID=UPI00016C4AB8|nr:hypothetical protein [Borreliella burgdorferi]ACM10160.1 conserved hypothetical protein [Borreliella burgdorferi 72a]ACO38098.1 conserved hypothetical protein [Borreliella burgdorferi 29805]MCR8905317.1 hypothetical protein [Borreliella burgdorferi]MCR8906686.1 hypothetical protein [Borreliella burgdorferi]PRQ97824.1 hypothetical protein CV679_04750 [Borreliella burgdorferi]
MGNLKISIELEIGWFGGRADIARMHEKGSSNLPARKHLTKIAGSAEFREYINNNYINSKFTLDPKLGMNSIGQAFIRYYENYVLSGQVKPDLKYSTIQKKLKKGSSTASIPLVDTSKMLSELTYKVILK